MHGVAHLGRRPTGELEKQRGGRRTSPGEVGTWGHGAPGEEAQPGGVFALLAGRRVETELALTSPGVHS